MMEDIVRELGFLTLGSRFRRIGERLQSDVQRLLDELGIDVQSGHFPTLAAIDRRGPLTIGEIAEAIGITQPGATRIIAQLAKARLVKVQPSREDQRRRLAGLTAKGQRLVESSKHDLWPRIDKAVEAICGELRGPLLEQLAAIEKGLEVMPLNRRVINNQSQSDATAPA
jgi:DNA-binding MarR family transcriptional regulator